MESEPIHVRYVVNDVAAAVVFYTRHLGFTVHQDNSPAFAAIDWRGLRLLLSGAASAGGQAMPDGRMPVAGGWNRIQVRVDDLAAEVARLRAVGITFRNDIVPGKAGAMIVLDDPCGNPVELFQAAPH